MNQQIITAKNTRFLLLLAFATGIISLNYSNSSFAQNSTADPGVVTVTMYDQPAAPFVKQFALMALFAKTSYRKDIENIKDKNLKKAKRANACNYIANPPGDKIPKNWIRSDKKNACYNKGGLFFETYLHKNGEETPDKAVISIRGTEGLSFNDWKANLSGIIPSSKNQYKTAKNTIVPLIGELKNDGVKEIYLTGHSLGGGIAQEIAYLSNDVIATYTFNTSPVTNWVKENFKGNIKVQNPKVFRVYMSKEILSIIRKITSRFNHSLPNRMDYQFNFTRKFKIMGAHAISHLACTFADQVAKAKEGADFDYSYTDAQDVSRDPNLCPPKNKEASPAENHGNER